MRIKNKLKIPHRFMHIINKILNSFSIGAYYRKQQFLEDLKGMNNQQLRVMFAAINSYYKVIATNSIKAKKNKENVSYLSIGIQNYMLDKMDSTRSFFNKNGTVEIDEDHPVEPDLQLKERIAGL